MAGVSVDLDSVERVTAVPIKKLNPYAAYILIYNIKTTVYTSRGQLNFSDLTALNV